MLLSPNFVESVTPLPYNHDPKLPLDKNFDSLDAFITDLYSGAIIYTYDLKVYTLNSTGIQQFGTFDKFATHNSQRWGINYISSGEQYTNMNNLSSTFFVLEMEDLLTHEITQRVYDFIIGTIN